MYVHERVNHGQGINIREGDTFVIPRKWLTLSFNPIKSTGQFFRSGLQWFAKLLFIDDLPNKKDELDLEIAKLGDLSDSYLKNSDLLKEFDIDNPDHSDEIIELLQENKTSIEWWAFLHGVFISIVKDAIAKNDTQEAVWAMACAERFRSMTIFKEHLEEVIWMGHSARRLINMLRTWDNNQSNSDEEYWQQVFTENSYALSQVFSVPVIFIQDKAYVGGMNVERKDAKFVDYLFSSESSREAILIEIKTPVTKLLGAKYRGIHKPSSELSDAVIQVQDYRNTLSKSVKEITVNTPYKLASFNPKCILIASNGNKELYDDARRKSFELFRTGLKDVEIVTYDELFRKVEVLATLFNLTRKKESEQPTE
ncbi:Shedu anti-phage system protein SduA domain-containing protein [Candidatus Leptofilum sp.]|uniref:Shedu anti-phage system protein SduA domain-containing protein n=1 Tax=Candidatus Leptofilum sp. TaxID=3241576 RepID=UPI003B5A4972